METNIVAGRFEGQKSPSLNFLYLDGSYASHRAMESLRHFEQNKDQNPENFFSYSRELVGSDTFTWSWMSKVQKKINK